MKYHSQLLKKYLSISASPEDIAQNLILKTCEIEEIHTRTIPETIVIGKIHAIEPHPAADKLNICQVDCGSKGIFQIICGGTNVKVWIFVPVALIGTFIAPTGITIAKRPMRGVDSEGMICSKQELSIAEDLEQHRIRNLNEDFEITDEDKGLALIDKFPWLNSTIFEVDNKSLTNRPDLTWHFGTAVELNAIYPDQSKKYSKICEYIESFKTTNILDILENTEKKLQKQILREAEAVTSYIALELKNITIKKSDFFTRLQLLDLGGKPINNWVDFSNIFMNISGQPIHLFDADHIKGAIILRDADPEEKFIDLFGIEHTLTNSDLVIADEEKILALAGIIWGLHSGISEHTKNIIVEIANFDPVKIRKTGTRLGLRTEAELRFEKNINPEFSLYALILFLDELKFYSKDLGNYEIWGLNYTLSPNLNPHEKKYIPTPRSELESLIFGQTQADFITKSKKILTDLGFHVLNDEVIVPFRRSPDDINIKEDIAEEIARIRGYEQINPQPLLAELKAQPLSEETQITREVESLMVEQFAFDQVETYPRTTPLAVKQFEVSLDQLYSLQNPLHPDYPLLRDHLLYNLIPLCQKNSKFFDECKLFDIGKARNKTTYQWAQALDPRYAENHIDESLQLWACIYKKNLENREQDPVLELKTIAWKLLSHLGIKGKIQFEKSDFSYFHPKKQAKIILRNGPTPIEIGQIASLHPRILKTQKFPETAQLATLIVNLEKLKPLLYQQAHEKDYETLQDQIIRRDLSFVIDKTNNFESLLTTLNKLPNIEEIKVFDLYQGNNIGANKKSISLQLKIKGDGNLTTEQINTILQEAIKKGESTGAQLRS